MSGLAVTGSAIRAWRALEYPPSASWVNWAVEQLEGGHDGPNLRILAGLSEPYDYFDTVRFTDQALAEVGVRSVPKAAAIESYAEELIGRIVHQPTVMAQVLSELAGLCVDADYPHLLMSFYLLHFARQDLQSDEEQYYWDGANASNIDDIVVNEARRWLNDRSRAA